MRLIDAGALIAEMHNVILEDGEDRRTFYEVIERQPTIDAVPVIRCENCKYSRNPNNLHFYCMCSMWERPVEKKGFCWLAESEESKC